MKHNLYLCTLYETVTPEMQFNYAKLKQATNIILKVVWLKAKFEKGSNKTDTPDTEEVDVRNVYLDKVPHNDFLIILDSDEVIMGPIKNGLHQLLTHMIDKGYLVSTLIEILPIITDDTMRARSRIIRKKDSMKYERKHDIIMYEGKSVLYEKDTMVFTNFMGFFHFKEDGEVGWK